MDFSAVYGASTRVDLMLLCKYCESLAGRQAMPPCRRFRLDAVPSLLGRLYLIDVLQGDYRFRLFGVFWESLYGFDLTDQRLSALEAEGHLTALRADYDGIVAARRPVFHAGRLVWPDQKAIRYERLLVPLSDDGRDVSQILVAAGCDVSLADLSRHKGRGRPQLLLD